MEFFRQAQPVFADGADASENRQFGFYRALMLQGDPAGVTLSLAANNVCRLYINGNIRMHGPARTAHGYARVDTLDLSRDLHVGINHIAVELIAYGHGFGPYSNDCTLDPAFLCLEIRRGTEVLCATGRDEWSCVRLTQRHPDTERISHCREFMEIYTPDAAYEAWRTGVCDSFCAAVPAGFCPVFLPHDALLPTLAEKRAERLAEYGGCRIDESLVLRPLFYEHGAHTGKEYPLDDCRRTVEFASFDVSARRTPAGTVFAGECDKYALYDLGESHVGFVRVDVTFAADGILDLVHTELLRADGTVFYPFCPVMRLHLSAGRHTFTAMEPGLGRYLKLYMRTPGDVTVHALSMLDDSYPDEHRSTFFCADEDLNRLYAAAKRTLLLNTLDVFMDCPDRERGGWLCDSLWTARAAALMLSDTRVEKEHIENFLLTDPDRMWNAFFPEVYPANKDSYLPLAGLTTWSFWLMCELCEYVRRTGDVAFRDAYRARIERFVAGSMTLFGGHGCLENVPAVFIDWSLSNRGEYLGPISVAVNALYAYMLCGLGELYGNAEWKETGTRLREKMRGATATFRDGEIDLFSDNLVPDRDGNLCQTDKYTEAALYTALWSGLWEKGENPALDAAVRDRMGPAPHFAPYPVLGRSGLFIGLCIRLDMLARRFEYGKMLEDLKAIYEPQLKEGPGTLWENPVVSTSSRCHGFNAHAGVHLMRDILGIGMPDACEHILTVCPHPQGLRWARGTIELDGQICSVSWQCSDTDFCMRVQVPEGWFVRFELPREIKALGDEHISLVTEEGAVSI